MFFGHPLGDRQTQAGASYLGREVGFEDTRQHLGRHTRPAVGDPDLGAVA